MDGEMNNEYLMMQARLLALTAQLEQMKTDNQLRALNQESPMWSGDHFEGLANDAQKIAESLE
jgi:hypothetical protein